MDYTVRYAVTRIGRTDLATRSALPSIPHPRCERDSSCLRPSFVGVGSHRACHDRVHGRYDGDGVSTVRDLSTMPGDTTAVRWPDPAAHL